MPTHSVILTSDARIIPPRIDQGCNPNMSATIMSKITRIDPAITIHLPGRLISAGYLALARCMKRAQIIRETPTNKITPKIK
jgi:hypothetical protein